MLPASFRKQKLLPVLPHMLSNASLQSIVDGEINVAQATAFMVLLHSKVMLHVQHDLLVAINQVILHTLCATLAQLKLLLACMRSKHKCSMLACIRAAGRVLLTLRPHCISSQEVT